MPGGGVMLKYLKNFFNISGSIRIMNISGKGSLTGGGGIVDWGFVMVRIKVGPLVLIM
jgi:hypothetical protein